MKRRYVVDPCFDGDTIPGRKRKTSWDVLDRKTGHSVSNHDTRLEARLEAKLMNDAEIDQNRETFR